jgi:hypothetical protein
LEAKQVLHRHWKRFGVIGGALALLALGALPAAASTPNCPAPNSANFNGTTVYVGQTQAGDPNDPTWHGTVHLHAYCGQADDAAHWLSHVWVKGIYASSNGTVDNLLVSTDGTNFQPLLVLDPLSVAPASAPYFIKTPAALYTDDNGDVEFTLYLKSGTPGAWNLAGLDGAAQVIGMQFDNAYGTVGGSSQTTFHFGGTGDISASTPELDSIFLFGSGVLGLAGYGVLRLRARRRN